MINKRIQARAVVSSLLIGVFLVCAATGLLMIASGSHQPHEGRIQNSASSNLETDRGQGPGGFQGRGEQIFNVKEMHEIFGLVLIILVIVHFALNFKTYVCEIKRNGTLS